MNTTNLTDALTDALENQGLDIMVEVDDDIELTGDMDDLIVLRCIWDRNGFGAFQMETIEGDYEEMTVIIIAESDAAAAAAALA